MKNFILMRDHVDIGPLLAEIECQPWTWDQHTGRQAKLKVQRESSALPLRGIVKSKIQGRKRRDVHESRYTTMSRNFPLAVNFILAFAAEQNAVLGRAKIVKLVPGAQVYSHFDRGEYYRIRDRYHLVLKSSEGNYLTAGDEHLHMKEGELWWFDNKAPHEAFNGSSEDRIHLIFDLLPRSPADYQRYRHSQIELGDKFLDLEAAFEVAQREVKALNSLDSKARLDVMRCAAQVVQSGVRLQLAGERHPKQWKRLLKRNHVKRKAAGTAPCRATAELLLGSASPAKTRRYARAIAWGLEELNAGAVRYHEIAGTTVQKGGVGAAARLWLERHGRGGSGGRGQGNYDTVINALPTLGYLETPSNGLELGGDALAVIRKSEKGRQQVLILDQDEARVRQVVAGFATGEHAGKPL